jgi:transcriptional regulator with XRE-family HTH domain
VNAYQTTDEMEATLGAGIKAVRLDQNIDQQGLAARAGISIGALKNLENGKGSTVRTLVSILKALNRGEWIATIAPAASINPLTLTEAAAPRQRATSPRTARS